MKNQWYLRTQDDTFGPETKERLIEWAQMGRIQPGQDISEDGETWRPATEIPFLDMRWSIDIGDGQPRGPFNKHAAQALLSSGRLPRGSKLVEVRPSFDVPAAGEVALKEGGRQDTQDTQDHHDLKDSKDPKAPNDIAELQALREQNARLEAKIKQMREDAKSVRAELADAQKLLAAKDSVLAERNTELAERASALEAKDSELAAKDDALAAKDTALAETSSALEAKNSELAAAREESEKTLRELESKKESELAAKDSEIAKAQEAVSAARANEAEYEAKILSLSDEIKRLPPTARLAADAQAAVYALMKEEADELAAALEDEKREEAELRQYRRQRTERLLTRRQELLRRIGTDAEDMTRRALLAHPDDPRTTQLRQELDALRILQERTALDREQKIRDLSAKLRERDTEVKRLQQQTGDLTVVYRQLQETREKLQRREKELMEERQKAEEERQQHAAAQQPLITRLSALEMGMPGATHQSREARSVRLAPWMGLKQ
jgi:chromosome segregation ATPase